MDVILWKTSIHTRLNKEIKGVKKGKLTLLCTV